MYNITVKNENVGVVSAEPSRNVAVITAPKGFKGEKGDAATVSVGTTSTGAAGTSASVTNSGTATDVALNFTIPKGVPGEGVPVGGTTGMALIKNSDADYDTLWSMDPYKGVSAEDVGLENVTNDAQLKIASNLSDLQSAATARTNLGLGNVDNTSDANKPISTSTQNALDLKANTADLGTAATANTVDLVQTTTNQTITGTKTFNGVINGEAVTQGATDTTEGRLLKVGDFGVGGQGFEPGTNVTDFNVFGPGRRFIGGGLGAANAPTGNRQIGLDVVWSGAPGFRSGHQLLFDSDSTTTVVEPRLHFRSYRESRSPSFGDWRELYHTGNTIVDGNGFIKEA